MILLITPSLLNIIFKLFSNVLRSSIFKTSLFLTLSIRAFVTCPAGLAMATMNKINVKSTAARFAAMLGGVAGVGIFAGSIIANFVGKKIINPLFTTNKIQKSEPQKDFQAKLKELNSERHPEMLDLSLHIDDVVSVGFLSGFKWIGPILPALYVVSGYRSGIGYRNGEGQAVKH